MRISDKAMVQAGSIGSNAVIHEFAVIRPGAVIGNNVVIHPFVVIESGVTIADDVEIFPCTYIGKAPKGAGIVARKLEFEPFVIIGSGCLVGPNAVIFYDVRIGDNTLIGDGASIREKCVVGSTCVIGNHVSLNYESRVGDRTKIMALSHITGNTVVGNDVFIGTKVGTANDNAFGKLGYDQSKVRGPYIDDFASVGSGAMLLPNIRVGKSAVIGAGAVVTRDVPDMALVMGVPAKVVRYLNQEVAQS